MTDLLTVAEFAKTLGVSPRTLLREINDGALPYVQVRLDPARKAKALAIGDGNVAKGVRAALDAFQNAGFPEATVDDSKAGALRAALEEAVAVLHSAGCDVTADACRRALTKQT